MANDRAPARHPGDADRQHRGDDCRQPFRYRGYGEGDAQNQHVQERGNAANVFDDDDRRNHDHGNDDDDHAEHPADTIELLLKRRRLARYIRQHSGNASHLSLHAGRDDNGAAAAVGD
jgi:hypothetical protein